MPYCHRLMLSIGHMLFSWLVMSNFGIYCPVRIVCADVMLYDLKAQPRVSVSSIPRYHGGAGPDSGSKTACLYERGGCGISKVWKTSAGAEIEDSAEKIRDAGTPICALAHRTPLTRRHASVPRPRHRKDRPAGPIQGPRHRQRAAPAVIFHG